MRLQFKSKWAHRVQAVLRLGPPGEPIERTAQPASALPVNPEWDDAFLRVESYLRAHQIESRVLLNYLTTDILTAARGLAVEHPAEAPVTLAINVTHARIGQWMVDALGEGDWADERFRARGRLALLMAEIPQRCPEKFLAHEELPAEIRAQLLAARLYPGPELRLASMPPSLLEFPLGEAVEEKWTTFSSSTFLRASMSWLVIASLCGVAWLATH